MRSRHFAPLRIRGDVRLPGLGTAARARVGAGRGVVLVGEPGEVVAELVDEDVGREGVVGGHRGEEVLDPAAAVLPVVHHDLDELVGRGGGGLAHPLVVEGEDVALRPESVVGGAERREAMDAVGGARHAALVGRRVDGPDVEVRATLLERRNGEEDLGQTLRVAVPLVHLGSGVAVAHQEEVDLVPRLSVSHHRPDRRRSLRGRSTDRGIRRVEEEAPGFPEDVLPISLLHHNLNGGRGRRETERLVERAGLLLGLPTSSPIRRRCSRSPASTGRDSSCGR